MKGFVLFVLAVIGLSAIGAALAYRIPTEKIVEKQIERPVEKTVIVEKPVYISAPRIQEPEIIEEPKPSPPPPQVVIIREVREVQTAPAQPVSQPQYSQPQYQSVQQQTNYQTTQSGQYSEACQCICPVPQATPRQSYTVTTQVSAPARGYGIVARRNNTSQIIVTPTR